MSKKKIYLWFLVPIWVFLLVKLIIPFLLYNNLNIQDMIGHYFNALYTKTYIWPDFMGWNPYHFLGYAPLQFYSPLFTILTVILGYIIPLKLSFKVVLSVAVLLTPLSFYYFSRKIGFDELKSSVSMLGMTSAMFFITDYVGGNISSTFNAGLVTTTIALPLLFFYLGKLNESFKTKKFVLVSVLMALIVLAHMFTAIIAAVLSLCFLFVKTDKKKMVFYAKHVLLTFLLTAFWFVPMILKLGYSGTIHIGPKIGVFWLYYAVLFAFVLVSAHYSRNIRQVSIGFIALLVVFLAGNFFEIPFHFYRMQLFIVLLMVVIGVNLLSKKTSYYIVSAIFVLLILFNLSNLYPEGLEDIEINDFGKVDGRVLVLNHADMDIGVHTLPYKVVMVTGNKVVKGLNIDATENGFLLGDFVKMIDSKAYIMYSDRFPMFDYEKNISLIPKQLSLLNINYIVAKNLLFGEKLDNVYEDYYLYKVSDSSFAEVLDYKPVVVKENFRDEAFRWFFEDMGKILVNDDVPEYVGTGQETVEVIEETHEMVKLRVDSDEIVPILIKMSYFPDWKAYVNGKETRIYKASPNLMVVYGRGEVEIRYGVGWWSG